MAMTHNCPKCRITRLDQRGESDIWICSRCGGVWAGREEVPRLGETPAPETRPEESVSVDAQAGVCPEGHGILSRARIDVRNPFSLERCTSCFGVWFDRGEWQRVADEHLANDLGHFWTREWREMRRRERSRKAHLDDARNDFGDDLYAKLSELAVLLQGNTRRSEALAFLREESIGRR